MSERHDTTAIWQTFSRYKTKLPQPLQRPSGCHHRLVNMQRASMNRPSGSMPGKRNRISRNCSKKRAVLGDHRALTSQFTPGRCRARLASRPEGSHLQLLQETYMTLSTFQQLSAAAIPADAVLVRPAENREEW